MSRNERSARRSSMRDKVRKQAEENKYVGGGGYLKLPEKVKFAKLKKGVNELDFLPFEIKENMTVPDTATKDMILEKGDQWYQRSIFIHHGIGADQKSFLCPRTIKKPCPICEERSRMMKDPNADEKLIGDLKPQHKDLFNVDGEEGVEILEFSYANFRKKLEEEIREGEEEWAGFADLEGGYTVKARMTEETFKRNKYLEASRIDFIERKDLPESVLDEVVDLNEILVILPYDQLMSVFLELDGAGQQKEESEGQESEEPPRRRKERASENQEHETEPEPRRDRASRRGQSTEEQKPEPAPEPEERPRRKREQPPEEKEPEPAPEPEPEERPRRRREQEETDTDGPSCPHGAKWGEDCDKLDHCYECKQWDACRDAADAFKKNQRKK